MAVIFACDKCGAEVEIYGVDIKHRGIEDYTFSIYCNKCKQLMRKKEVVK